MNEMKCGGAREKLNEVILPHRLGSQIFFGHSLSSSETIGMSHINGIPGFQGLEVV